MKKILFLIILMCIFFPSIYAYDFMYWDSNVEGGSGIYQFFIDSNAQLKNKIVYNDGRIVVQNKIFYTDLNYMRNTRVYNGRYVTNDTFINYYKNNLDLLNAFYKQKTNEILNYFYNENNFNNSNYIEYLDYKLLYNSDGLVVESIVGGVWAGLYDNSEDSGYLFDSSGKLLYKNGVRQEGLSLIINTFIFKIIQGFNSIDWKTIALIPVIVLTVSLFYLVINKIKGALHGSVKTFN